MSQLIKDRKKTETMITIYSRVSISMIDFAYMNPDFIDTILYHGNIFLLFMSLCDD